MLRLGCAEFLDALRTPPGREHLTGATGGSVVVVDVEEPALIDRDAAALGPVVEGMPAVLIGCIRGGVEEAGTAGALFDIVVGERDEALEAARAAEAHPHASTALALLLRESEHRSIAGGLVAESSTYSLLQAGPEHNAWLAGRPERPPRQPGDGAAPVRVVRNDTELAITLTRPEVRNAYNAAMRDALLEAFTMVALDETITDVVVSGEGPSFCSGGDLDEFGTLADPASAHALRLARSAGSAIHSVADRVTFRVHGACIGAGIELPAFAGRIVAHADARFALPEVSMGLVPGAGGTVSLPRRIGRHRTAWLALTGHAIDAPTALAWHLIDTIA